MFDELERLCQNERLRSLLGHYVQAGEPDRDAWVDRLMHVEEVDAKELVKLHGELLAHQWLEQNTGVIPVLQPGDCLRCYRATAAGRKALTRATAEIISIDDSALAA